MNMRKVFLNNGIYLAWIIAAISMFGSLFFSEVLLYPPCALCWYQRIAMYPLVVLLAVGMFQPIKNTVVFSLPIALVGWCIALFHNLLHYGIVSESASPCREGVSCATVYINWLGFITIPMLSFVAFSVIVIILVLLFKGEKSE
jgi:disulfide bond formation protein DsbB